MCHFIVSLAACLGLMFCFKMKQKLCPLLLQQFSPTTASQLAPFISQSAPTSFCSDTLILPPLCFAMGMVCVQEYMELFSLSFDQNTFWHVFAVSSTLFLAHSKWNGLWQTFNRTSFIFQAWFEGWTVNSLGGDCCCFSKVTVGLSLGCFSD